MSLSETARDTSRSGMALPLDADVLRLTHKLREVGRELDQRYLDKSELVRMLLVTLVAGEHMLIVGPPGTAKSALVRHLARLIDARYFEYLRRLLGPTISSPVDIKASAKAATCAWSRHAAGSSSSRRDLQVERRRSRTRCQPSQRDGSSSRQRIIKCRCSLYGATNEGPTTMRWARSSIASWGAPLS